MICNTYNRGQNKKQYMKSAEHRVVTLVSCTAFLYNGKKGVGIMDFHCSIMKIMEPFMCISKMKRGYTDAKKYKE